jgi:signal transduction histidine kinase
MFDFRIVDLPPEKTWRRRRRSDLVLSLLCVLCIVPTLWSLRQKSLGHVVVVVAGEILFCWLAAERLSRPNRFFMVGGLGLSAVCSLFAVLNLDGGVSVNVFSVLIGVYSAARFLRVRTAAAFVLATVLLWSPAIGTDPLEWVGFVPFGVVAPFVVGKLVAKRAADQRVAESQDSMRTLQLAGELHDAVGHHLTALAVQVRAASAVLALSPERAKEALVAARSLAATSLDELRQVVQLLESNGGQESTRQGIAVLEEELKATEDTFGFSVSVQHVGSPRRLTPVLEHTVYRIVQESITNIAKHVESPSNTTVEFQWLPSRLQVSVRNGGRARVTRSFLSGGSGIANMRDRVRLLGGAFRSVPTGNGWLVRMSLSTDHNEPNRTIRSQLTRIGTSVWKFRDVAVGIFVLFALAIALRSTANPTGPLAIRVLAAAMVLNVAFVFRRRIPEVFWVLTFALGIAQQHTSWFTVFKRAGVGILTKTSTELVGLEPSGDIYSLRLGFPTIQLAIATYGITRVIRPWWRTAVIVLLLGGCVTPGVGSDSIQRITQPMLANGMSVGEARSFALSTAAGVFVAILLVLAVGVFFRRRETRTQLRLSGARIQLAGELRESVGNQISGLHLLASGTLEIWTANPGVVAASLAELSTRSTEALNELRRLVGVLRSSSKARTSVADLTNAEPQEQRFALRRRSARLTSR